jgi:hypothetical protein
MAEEKKIIIDEDWKSQVQAEKEAAAKSKAGESPEQSGARTQSQDRQRAEMPPASLQMLLTMLATEAMVALGQIPHPATGAAHADRDQAQYLIDLIEVIRDKTKGNLTPNEQQLTDTLLHQLRLAFVETASTTVP